MMSYTANADTKQKPNEIITGKIIEALNRGIIPWKQPWETLEVMSVDGRPYRGVNRILLSWAGYSDPRFITYRRCAEMGGNVRKGEKGFPVVLWNSRKVDVTEKDKQGNKITVTKQVPFMRYYYVFNVEQCDGLADKLKPLERKSIDFRPIDAARRIVDGFVNKPTIRHGGSGAYYSPMTDTVQMPNPEAFHSAEHYYATEFHELIHSTGHTDRLNREFSAYVEAYSKEELVAEIGSAFLCAEAHIDSSELGENTVAYIQSWIQALRNDHNMVIQAAGKAQKAADFIMGRGQANQGEGAQQVDEAA
jgi:antirestriction protein ArdC